MDTQRLILFVIFSFSALFLWEAWQREHRRFEHDTPGTRKRRQLNLLVAIDVSESTDRQPLREAFARELLQIARGRDSRITVLYAHSRIRRIEQFRSSQAVATQTREVECELTVQASGSLATRLAQQTTGTQVKLEGVLNRRSVNSRQLILILNRIEKE